MVELPEKIEALKDLHIETPLLRGRRPQSVIVVPSDGSADAAAARLQAVVRHRWGVDIPLASGAPTGPADLLAKSHVVALGCMADNAFIERLYYEQYTILDRWYPGPGGHVVRSLHNPLGTGRNVIFCGGSDSRGVDTAVEALSTRLADQERPVLGWLEEVTLGKGHTRPRAGLPGNLLVFQGPPRKKLGWNEASQLALRYHYTGDERWAEAFKKAALKTDLLETCDHYWSHKVYPVWDLIEESPAFLDEERLAITNKLLAHLRSPESAGSAGVLAGLALKSHPRGRHAMARAMNILLGCRYFSRGYPADCWEPLLDLVDRFWAAQMTSSKGMSGLTFGVSSYLDLALDHALLTGNGAFFESGAFGAWAERLFLLCNNLGFEVMSGQYSAEHYPEAALSKAAHLLDDGRFLHLKTLRDRARKGQDVHNVIDFASGQAFAGDVAECPAVNQTGVVVSPADRTYFDAFCGQEIPFGEAFDRLTFRSGFEPSDQFLTLNGICSGTKFFPDINAIQEWSEHGRVLLTTCDSGVQTEGIGLRAANTICVTVNGESGPTPTAAGLLVRASRGRLAHTCTVAPNHGAADWARHLFWVREEAFIVMDVLSARQAGEYAFRCQWRMLGDVENVGRDTRLRLGSSPWEDGSRVSHVLSAGSEEVTLFRDLPIAGEGGAGEAFAPYAGRTLNQIHQVNSLRMEEGDWVVFANLLFSEREAKPAEGLFREVEDGVFAFSVPICGYLGLAPEGEVLILRRGRVAISGGALLVARGEALVTEARSISVGADAVTVSSPVTLHADLATGEVTVEASEPVTVTLSPSCAVKARLNGRRPFLTRGESGSLLALPGGTHLLSGVFADGARAVSDIEAHVRAEAVPVPPVTAPPESSPASSAPAWVRAFVPGPLSPDADSRIPPMEGGVTALWADRAPDPGRPFAVVGLRDGQAEALDSAGKTLWTYRAGDAVCTVTAGDAGGDRRVLIGSDDAKLACLDGGGTMLWEKSFPVSDHTLAYPWWNLGKGRVRSVTVADLDGDGKPEIAVGTGGALVHLLDFDGNERWQHPMRWGMAAHGFSIDLNGDGRRELVVGMDRLTMTSRLYTFAGDGSLLPNEYTKTWREESIRTPSWEQTGASAADYLNRNGGRAPIILVGRSGAFNQLSAYDAVTEEHLWKREMGDRISGMVVADIDRDGGKDVAVSTHAGWVVCYDSSGNRRWGSFLGSPVTALCRSSLRGSQLTAGTYGGVIYLIDQRGRRQRIRTGTAPVTRIAAAYRGARVVCASGDEVFMI